MDVSSFKCFVTGADCLYALSVAKTVFNTAKISIVKYTDLLCTSSFCVFRCLDTGKRRFTADVVLVIVVYYFLLIIYERKGSRI